MADKSITASIARDWAESDYYQLAEQELWRDLFWSQTAPFRPRFDKLKLGSVIELACGRGRHAAMIVDRCEELLLVDVNETNIAACQERFADRNNVRFTVNDGFSIPAPDKSADSIFSYDSMVHFEYDAVLNYIAEAARVLKPGGRALFHHSNYDAAPGAHYHSNPHWRNFMSKALFQHAAARRGFTILDSVVFGWGGGEAFHPDLDCLTLMELRG